mmetsp:Transcript_2632/g.3209  ORF Transcript_2632/g.3209 Transcript_2632/m.3209 type:complete len:347 (-) Transcript_2632:2504-3544(-)
MERAARVLTQCVVGHEQSCASFRYTLDNSLLSTEQRDFYEENGFLVVKNLLQPHEVDTLAAHFGKLCSGEIEPYIGMSIMRDISVAKTAETKQSARIITKIQDWQDDEVLFEYCKHPRILDYVECFTGPNIRSIHTMIIQKPVVTNAPSSRHPLHQDLVYFPFRPADKIVCSWTCMEERISRENGGLVVIPGSHKPPIGSDDIITHKYPSEWERVNKLYYGIEMDEKLQKLFDSHKVYLDMQMGDTVFFHPLLIHGSGANKSQKFKFRKAISCHYASSECSGISDMSGTKQEEIANEILELANSRYGASEFDINFLKIWLFKSRQVRGSLPDDPDNIFVQYQNSVI